jgi:hypothetical protein
VHVLIMPGCVGDGPVPGAVVVLVVMLVVVLVAPGKIPLL